MTTGGGYLVDFIEIYGKDLLWKVSFGFIMVFFHKIFGRRWTEEHPHGSYFLQFKI